MSVNRAPRAELTWNATALGTGVFGGYEILRRASHTPVRPWKTIGIVTVPTGYTGGTVEAQHRFFYDYEAAWAVVSGQWQWGWDYAVRVINFLTGLKSDIGSGSALRVQVTADTDSWTTSNKFPYLNAPIWELEGLDTSIDNRTEEKYFAGRDFMSTRTPIEMPSRMSNLSWRTEFQYGEAGAILQREAARKNRRMAFLTPRGDRIIGTMKNVNTRQTGDTLIDVSASLTEVSAESEVADFNLPAGIVLNGTSQYIQVTSNALLNPGSGDFTIFVCGVFANSAATRYALSKGNLGTADGYGIRTSAVANQLQFFMDGASASGSLTITNSAWFDGLPHVAIGVHTGFGDIFYRDDNAENVVGAVNPGAITNAVNLLAGANNGGAAANFMALNPIHAFGYYGRALTATEAEALGAYCLGYAGATAPAGAALFVDLRDDRTWQGIGATLKDLSGNNLSGTSVATPATRGIPWELETLEV